MRKQELLLLSCSNERGILLIQDINCCLSSILHVHLIVEESFLIMTHEHLAEVVNVQGVNFQG